MNVRQQRDGYLSAKQSFDDVIGGHIGFNHPDIGSSSTSEAQSVMDFFPRSGLSFFNASFLKPVFGY